MARKKTSTSKDIPAAVEPSPEPEAAVDVLPTTMQTARPAEAPMRASASREAKRTEVIPPVAVKLLEDHPALPDKAEILEAFAAHYRDAAERAARPPEPPKAPEPPPEPERGRGRVRRGSASSLPAYTAPVAAPMESSPSLVLEPAPVTPPTPQTTAPTLETAVDPGPSTDELAALDATSVFGVAAIDDDIFASLEREPTFDVTAERQRQLSPDPFADASAPEEPFAATLPAEPVTNVGDDAFPVFEDPSATSPSLAGPSDSTMMMQAMPDDDDTGSAETLAEPAEPVSNDAKTRKSRKASTKKKR